MPTGWRWSFPRLLGSAAFLAMLLFWIWAFANRDSIAHPDTFDDPAYVVAAESVCAPRQANIGDLPLATAAKNAIERGELLELGTIQLELMVAELGQRVSCHAGDGIPNATASKANSRASSSTTPKLASAFRPDQQP